MQSLTDTSVQATVRVVCTAQRCLDSYGWKVCDTHGRFPVWLGQCPESGVSSTGDALMDMCIDMLLRPGTTLYERDSARRVVALAVRDRPSLEVRNT